MREFLDKECTRKNIERKSYFDKWVNIRWLFAEFFYCSRGGVNKMLSRLGLKFEGKCSHKQSVICHETHYWQPSRGFSARI